MEPPLLRRKIEFGKIESRSFSNWIPRPTWTLVAAMLQVTCMPQQLFMKPGDVMIYEEAIRVDQLCRANQAPGRGERIGCDI